MKHVVVLLSGSPCAEYPDTKCVMEVIGPFDSRADAEAELARSPEWASPHLVPIREPGSTAPAGRCAPPCSKCHIPEPYSEEKGSGTPTNRGTK